MDAGGKTKCSEEEEMVQATVTPSGSSELDMVRNVVLQLSAHRAE